MPTNLDYRANQLLDRTLTNLDYRTNQLVDRTMTNLDYRTNQLVDSSGGSRIFEKGGRGNGKVTLGLLRLNINV